MLAPRHVSQILPHLLLILSPHSCRDPEPPFDTQPVIKRGELKEAATSVLFWPPQEPWPICATTDAAGSLISIEYVAEAAAPSAVAVADSAQVAGGAAAAAAAAGPVLTAAAADTARMSVAQLVVYPAKHYVTSEERLKLACGSIRVRQAILVSGLRSSSYCECSFLAVAIFE